MIVVKVELHSAITGKISLLGKMIIANTGGGTAKRGNYSVAVLKKTSADKDRPSIEDVLRHGEVLDYPRLSYNVWRLVSRALRSAFPEEK